MHKLTIEETLNQELGRCLDAAIRNERRGRPVQETIDYVRTLGRIEGLIYAIKLCSNISEENKSKIMQISLMGAKSLSNKNKTEEE